MERKVQMLKKPEHLEKSEKELKNLWRRITLINRSIGLCTASALFICAVVVFLFVGDLWLVDITQIIVSMFVCGLFLLIFALLTFLREVQLATQTLQMGKEIIEDEAEKR
jgi:Flp pilus assembly protein TadB